MKSKTFQYQMINTHGSSDRYGLCEVCGKHAPEIWHMIESQHYSFEHEGKNYSGYTYDGCENLFGHYNCLDKIRKEKDKVLIEC